MMAWTDRRGKPVYRTDPDWIKPDERAPRYVWPLDFTGCTKVEADSVVVPLKRKVGG